MERLVRRSWGQSVCPAALGRELKVPTLAVRQDGALELFDDQFQEVTWNLAECDASLSEAEFGLDGHGPQGATVDVDEAGKAHWQVIEEMREQVTLNDLRGPKTATELALWLDREIPHPDIPQHQAGLFLRKVVDTMTDKRGIPLAELVRARFRLKDAVAQKIDGHRRSTLSSAYQRMLLPEANTPLEVSAECCFTYPLDEYPANRLYQGRVQFQKHYYERPGDMNDEEAACAAVIDSLNTVEYWVRNLERQPTFSFWLQTSTDKFYPDFVAKLHDGRILAVEYKGEDRLTTDDTREKKVLGELWAARSRGKCLFLLVSKQGMEQAIRQALS